MDQGPTGAPRGYWRGYTFNLYSEWGALLHAPWRGGSRRSSEPARLSSNLNPLLEPEELPIRQPTGVKGWQFGGDADQVCHAGLRTPLIEHGEW